MSAVALEGTSCSPDTNNNRSCLLLTPESLFLGIEQLGEARIFLKEREVFIVARVVAVFRAQLNGDLKVFQRGVGFAGEAIERRQRVVNMVGFGRGLARFVKALARVVPAADIHHGHAALIMIFGALGILF